MVAGEKDRTLFFELLQVVQGQREALSHHPSDEEWKDIYELSQKHAIAGVVFSAIDKLSSRGHKDRAERVKTNFRV